jgi:hypothetical protein
MPKSLAALEPLSTELSYGLDLQPGPSQSEYNETAKDTKARNIKRKVWEKAKQKKGSLFTGKLQRSNANPATYFHSNLLTAYI